MPAYSLRYEKEPQILIRARSISDFSGQISPTSDIYRGISYYETGNLIMVSFSHEGTSYCYVVDTANENAALLEGP